MKGNGRPGGISVTAAVVILGLAASGCAGAGGLWPSQLDRSRPAPVWAEVTNNYGEDVRVYLVVGGARFPLGRVTATETARFRLRASLVPGAAEVRLLMVGFASNRQYVSTPVNPWPGETVKWTIERNPALSWPIVYP